MSGFKNRKQNKQMTKREMQDQIVSQAENAIKMTQGLAVVVNQQIRNLKLETANLAAMSIMKDDSAGAIDERSIAYIDFVGYLDEKPFEGGEGIGVFVDMEVHQFLPDFQKNLLGAKVGEEKTFEVKFPDNYQAKTLAGKTATFEVMVRKVFREIPSKIAEKAAGIQKERAAKKAAEQAAAAEAAKKQQESVAQQGG